MKQQTLFAQWQPLPMFPEWGETLKTDEIKAQALRLAQTPIQPTAAENRQYRPVIDTNHNGIQSQLIKGIT